MLFSAISVQGEDCHVDGGHSRRRHGSLGSQGGEGGDVRIEERQTEPPDITPV